MTQCRRHDLVVYAIYYIAQLIIHEIRTSIAPHLPTFKKKNEIRENLTH